ncbi:MAG: hypothetical protein AAGA56_00735 [Myxococcota bacterium]
MARLGLRSSFVILGALVATAASVNTMGCGSSDEETPTDGAAVGQVPARPADAPAANGQGTAFAVSRLYLGDTDRDGGADPNAWRSIGYNLDGLVTGGDASGHCQPVLDAAPQQVFRDGIDGIDNSFGNNLVGIISEIIPGGGLSAQASDAILEGDFTVIANLTNLDSAPNSTGVASTLLVGAPNMGTVDLTTPGATTWPFYTDSAGEPLSVSFSDGYVNNNTFASGSPQTINLAVSVGGFDLELTIASAVITMDLDAERGLATNGIIAGVLEVEPLLTELEKIAGSLSTMFCDPESATVQQIFDQVRRQADIMADGTQDPNATCNAISVGIGFDATAINVGEGVAAPTDSADPCAEDGGEGGGNES